MRKFSASEVGSLYRHCYKVAFTHIPKPRFKMVIGPEPEGCLGEYDPNNNTISVWLDEHQNIDDIFDTIVHELCHAEQEKKLQPLLHGPRFSRRMRVFKRRINR